MEKFTQIQYKRPDMNAFNETVKKFIKQFPEAVDYPEARALYMELNRSNDCFDTMYTVAEIRNTVNTADEFYEKEMEFFAEAVPKAQLQLKAAHEVFLASAYVEQFENEFGNLYIRNIKNQIRFANEDNVENKIRESRLTQQYAKASAICTTMFHGEEVNFYGLLKFMQSPDRNIRREAFNAWADLYESVSGELDHIYDELIKVRCDMAKVLGFKDYIEMAYQSRERYDYDRKDVENFRKQILTEIVPVCTKLFEQQRERLGLDKLCYYDEALVFPEGNAVPQGTVLQLVERAREMYHELSKETGEFFDYMVQYELFDLETKPGKRQGGYCTFMSEFNAPFIFSNFNGTSADVDVLTHEAGHAFEAYTASRRYPLASQVWSTTEIDEIHSMSMEFFTYPWMDKFFGSDGDKYRYAHLVSALTVLPYMACVDEFQHRVFDEMAVDGQRRRCIWREIEKKYMPWRDYDGNSFLENGGFWMQKQHIFLFPFYYIDYALAQMGAFEFYGRMKKDRKEAWDSYYRLCCAGGSKGYFDLLKIAGLSSPFDDGTVKKVLDSIGDELTKSIEV